MPRIIDRRDSATASNRFWHKGELCEYTGAKLSGYAFPFYEARYLSGPNKGEIFVTVNGPG